MALLFAQVVPFRFSDGCGRNPLAAAAATVNGVGAVAGVTMDRVFRQGDRLSLAALPKGDNATADAMLALLYGYLKMQGEPTVNGVRKARRYQSNNRGLTRAEEVIKTILE